MFTFQILELLLRSSFPAGNSSPQHSSTSHGPVAEFFSTEYVCTDMGQSHTNFAHNSLYSFAPVLLVTRWHPGDLGSHCNRNGTTSVSLGSRVTSKKGALTTPHSYMLVEWGTNYFLSHDYGVYLLQILDFVSRSKALLWSHGSNIYDCIYRRNQEYFKPRPYTFLL